MLKELKGLLHFLRPQELKHMALLQFVVAASAVFEVASIIAIGVFVGLVTDSEQAISASALNSIYALSGAESSSQFTIYFGTVVFSILLFSSLISMYAMWALSRTGARIGAAISSRLYRYFISQDWLYHANNNSAQITKKIAHESQRVGLGVIIPLMHLNAKIVMVFFVGGFLFIYNPLASILGITVFAVLYVGLYNIVRFKVGKLGNLVSTSQTDRFKLMSDGFGGVKEVILGNKQEFYAEKFDTASEHFTSANAGVEIVSLLPRYVIEFFVFGTFIGLVIYSIYTGVDGYGDVLPLLAVYAMSALKLLPAFQQVYYSLSRIKGNIPALQQLSQDMKNTVEYENGLIVDSSVLNNVSMPKSSIAFKNISFSYPESKVAALNDVSVAIECNQTTLFLGRSGSGKSTLINLIAGLLKPTSGTVTFDECEVVLFSNPYWYGSIGYVPQSVYLVEGTIRENVAFGICDEDIDDEAVVKALTQASAIDFVNELGLGFNEPVGERGAKLSGGQIQRLGIARALYHDPEILIFDESTSALDHLTEQKIMEVIFSLAPGKTVVFISHKVTMAKDFDNVYVMERGAIEAFGSFSRLKNLGALDKFLNIN